VVFLSAAGPVHAACVGDCDENGRVTVEELVTAVNIALGNATVDACPAIDADNSKRATIDELVTAVNNALNGCAVRPTPTPTPTPPGPTVTPIGNATPTPSTTASPGIAFQPMTGPRGESVVIKGPGLAGTTGVTFNGSAASFTIGAGDSVTATVPQSATTGSIRVTTAHGTISSNAVFVVLVPSTFTLTLGPNAASVIQGQSTSYTVTLQSANGFTQLADLSVSGLAAGLTATLTPPRITAGQTGLLTLSAPSNQPTGASNFTVSAGATVLGQPQSTSANASVTVQPVTTSFLGRTVVDDTMQTALAGVTITFLGKDGAGNSTGCSGQTVSDAAGNFVFSNLPDQCIGSQLIRYDGSSATAPGGRYAGVDLIYTLVAHQVVVSPVLVHLPRIDDRETVMVKQNAPMDQTFTFTTIPFLSITVYAGTILTMPDGSQPDPFPLTAVEVPVDRLPEEFSPQAQNPTSILGFIVAFQPANAVASQPVAVTFPNTLNTPPGTFVQLFTLDPTRGQMIPYGSGRASNDGMQIIPNADPAHPGHAYGLVNFDWHGPTAPPSNNNDPGAPNFCPPGADCPCPPQVGRKPVDVSSGLEILTETDIDIGGVRGGLTIERTYRTGSNTGGPFGIGTNHNYGYQLGLTGQAVINLIVPQGNQFPFNQQPDGTFINSTIPTLHGAVLSIPASGVFDLRWKNGTVYQFSRFNLLFLLTSITDANGSVTTITRGSNPTEIAQIVDPVGRVLSLQYDASSRITSITDPLGRTVHYTYNTQGTLATVTDAAGGVTNYDYDAQNRLTAVTDPRGVIVAQNAYDQNGRVRQQTLADGGTYTFTYSLLNPAAPAVSPVLRTTVLDPLNKPTTYHFNAQGYLIDITDATGQVRVFHRDAGTNLLLSVTGTASCSICGLGNGGDRSFTYDSNGNVTSIADALGNTARFTYEPTFNRLATATDTLGNVERFEYDDRGNLIARTDAGGSTLSFDYDGFGELTRITDPLGNSTTLSYDALGDVVTIVNAAGETSAARYDVASRQIQVTDALGRVSSRVFDALDQLTSQTDARNNTTHYTYDTAGNPLTLTDARGNTTSFTYDSVGRQITKTTPGGATETVTYDRNGNITRFVDRRGQVSQFTYDLLDRMTRATYQDGTTVSGSYDANGRLVQAVDSASGRFTFAYDLAGRTTQSTSPFGAVNYVYDSQGRITSRTVVGQAPVQYTYDSLSEVLQAATTHATVTLAYGKKHTLDSLSRANGVTSAYAYDAVGRVLSVSHMTTSASLSAQHYTYNAAGFRNTMTTDNAGAFTTPAVSNQFDTDNRLTHRGATVFTYDANGNLASTSGPDGTTTYSWDARNQLRAVVGPTGQRTDLVYDFDGNLIAQSDSGPILNRSRSFVLDDLSNIALIQEDNVDQMLVVSGRGIDQHFAVVHSDGAVEYALTDAINSTVATVDESGHVVDRFTYDPFGLTANGGSGFPFQYTGRLPITGSLYSYRARYYDAALGRFTSEDPLGFLSGDVNAYRYVGNSPLNLIDPSGYAPVDPAVQAFRNAVSRAVHNPNLAKRITDEVEARQRLVDEIKRNGKLTRPSPNKVVSAVTDFCYNIGSRVSQLKLQNEALSQQPRNPYHLLSETDDYLDFLVGTYILTAGQPAWQYQAPAALVVTNKNISGQGVGKGDYNPFIQMMMP